MIPLPDCPWGIVCNCVSFRLYHRNQTPGAYELFVLQDLRDKAKFRKFYYLLGRDGLLPGPYGKPPHADALLESAGKRQREVGDELYRDYHQNRVDLVQHLLGEPHNKPQDTAIGIAQRLLDRIIFVAFCEDRGLLPSGTIRRAYETLPPFQKVTNPRWQNFRALFRSIDKGNDAARISAFNGGLFRDDPEVDDLELDDRWTLFFNNIGAYDFRDEVNVDVLGHLFERSVGDIGRMRLGGLFQAKPTVEPGPKMGKSAERKRGGIYYTPPEITSFIVDHTVVSVAVERLAALDREFGVDKDRLKVHEKDSQVLEYCRRQVEALRNIKVVDPACGSGAFLIKAYDALEDLYHGVADVLSYQHEKEAITLRDAISGYILGDNLFGVDLSPEAVEITQLALWIRSAREGKTLEDLSSNIVCGNSLVSDPAVHPKAMDWRTTFPVVHDRKEAGFDCVIGNPPWERMKLQEREFFDIVAPDIASAENAATRRKLIAKLKVTNPELHERYLAAQESAEKTLDNVRNCGRFPLTGKGDTNTYAVFAELARSVVAPTGRVGILVPTGIATDSSTQDFFGALVDGKTISGLYDFENRLHIFPDIDPRMKFAVLLFSGAAAKTEAADFVFFAHAMKDVLDKSRHVTLRAADFKLLNPNTRTCPVFRSPRDAELTKAVYRRVPPLVERGREKEGNLWGVGFARMFDQTNDAELFRTSVQLAQAGFKRYGAGYKKGKKECVPLYEAKMIQMYDHRAASVIVEKENWFRQGQTDETSVASHQNSEFTATPRWWADKSEVAERLGGTLPSALLVFKNVTSPTNRRTMIAALIPAVGVINSAPLILLGETVTPRLQCCLLATLNSFALDYIVRQKIGNVNLNFFIIEQLPVFAPDFFEMRCPWDRSVSLERWVSDRVLKLTCTSDDMIPLAKAAGFKEVVHRWKPDERAQLMAELDAAYFLLYGVKRDDAEFVLSTFSGTADSIPELFGSASTKDLILSHYDRLKSLA